MLHMFGINMLVTPSSGTMVEFDWPRFIPLLESLLHTKRFYNGAEHDHNTLLMYSVGGDSMIDRAATIKAGGAVRMLICHNRKGCKRASFRCAAASASEFPRPHQPRTASSSAPAKRWGTMFTVRA